MILKNLILKKFYRNILFKDYLFIFCLISFFFLWDVKINLFQNFIISPREIFFLLFIYFLIDYKKSFNSVFIKIFLSIPILLIHSYIAQYPLSFNLLDFKYNLLPILFVFFVLLICYIYIEEINKNLNLVFIIFIYILFFSFFFIDAYDLSTNEMARVCTFIGFKLIGNKIFLEASHLGMVLVPIYYYIFAVNNLNYFHKIFFLLFLLFIVLFYSSITLVFSAIICFVLAIFIDHRFFLKNKLFLFFQVLILLLPIFKNSCMFKVNDTLINLNKDSIVQNDREFFSLIEPVDQLSIRSNIKRGDELITINLEEFYKTMNERLSALKLPLERNEKISISKVNELIQLSEDTLQKLMFVKLELDRVWFKVNEMDKGTEQQKVLENAIKDKEEINNIIGNFKRLRGYYIKKNILHKLDQRSAKEINDIIKKNVGFFPIQKQKNVNDHSSAVLLNAITVAYYAIKEKPFGWGFNNYQTAFNKYVLDKITPSFHEIYYLNFNDASNNSIKLIVEFGVFALFIFANLIYFVLNKKIASSQRLLFGGIIAIQMVRAAGYFNGGFILCLVITFILNYKSLTKNEQ